MSVTALHRPKAKAMTPAAHAVNALWSRLDQARAVALCIPDKCDTLADSTTAAAVLAQVAALSGAVAELLALAQGDIAALEALV